MKKILIFLPLLLVLSGCFQQKKIVTLTGRTMGTTYSVKFIQSQGVKNQEIIKNKIDTRLAEINGMMSTYDSSSELSSVNQNFSNDWIQLSLELFVVIKAAFRISNISNGAYDVTIGPLVNLWGFGPKKNPEKLNKVPTIQSINEVMIKTGYTKIKLDIEKRRLKKDHPHIYIDLASIAKGYGVDQVAQTLEENKIFNYMVEVGGEVKTKGLKGEKPWKIAIEAPYPDRGQYQRILDVSNFALATSGNYRIFFEDQNRKFSHIINPVTGRPVTHSLASVTVIDKSCMKADALATMLMVMGPVEGYDFAVKHKLKAYFIYKEDNKFKVRSTQGFEEIFY